MSYFTVIHFGEWRGAFIFWDAIPFIKFEVCTKNGLPTLHLEDGFTFHSLLPFPVFVGFETNMRRVYVT